MSWNIGGHKGSLFYIGEKVFDSAGKVTSYKIFNGLTDTSKAMSTATITDAAFSLTEHQTTKIDYDETGNIKFDFKHYQTTTQFRDLLKKIARPAIAGKKRKDYVCIDGTEHKGSASGKYFVLAILPLLNDDDDTPTKIWHLAAAGNFTPTSGSLEVGGENESSPTFVFESAAVDVEMVIPGAMFDATLVTPPTGAKIEKGRSYWDSDIPVKTVTPPSGG